jgi:hypothetical protein
MLDDAGEAPLRTCAVHRVDRDGRIAVGRRDIALGAQKLPRRERITDRNLRTRSADFLFLLRDDASVVGAAFAVEPCMAEKSFEGRIAALEAQLTNKTIEQHFREQAELIGRRIADSFREQAELIDRRFADGVREQAELIDRLFVYRFEELDKEWGAKLDSRLSNLEARLETKVDAKLEPIRRDLTVIKHAVNVILTRLP